MAVTGGRLPLNECLQSISNAIVYEAGDAAATVPPLTPVSSHDGKIGRQYPRGRPPQARLRGVSSVAFTLPPIAAFGLSEAAARAQGRAVRVNSAKVLYWYIARRGLWIQDHLAEDTGGILGAYMVGPHADEVINLFAIAIRLDLTAEDLKSMMFAYPTEASDERYML